MTAEHLPEDWGGVSRFSPRAIMGDEVSQQAWFHEEPDVSKQQSTGEVLTNGSLEKTLGWITARVVRDSEAAERGHRQGVAFADAQWAAQVAMLDTARHAAHTQLGELSSARDAFAELCSARRAELNDAIADGEQEIAKFEEDARTDKATRAEFMRKRSELNHDLRHKEEGIITHTELIQDCDSQSGELRNERINIEKMAAKRREQAGDNKVYAIQAAETRFSAHNEDVDAIYAEFEHQGVVTYGQDHAYSTADKQDVQRLEEIDTEIRTLRTVKNSYDSKLTELEDARDYLLDAIETYNGDITRLSTRLKVFAEQTEILRAGVLDLSAEASVLDSIEVLDIHSIEEDIPESLLAPLTAAQKLVELLAQDRVVVCASEVADEGMSEGAAVNFVAEDFTSTASMDSGAAIVFEASSETPAMPSETTSTQNAFGEALAIAAARMGNNKVVQLSERRK